MLRFLVCTNRNTNSPTQGSSKNRTIATADLIADCCAGGTANAAANGRIQGGTIRVRISNHK